MIVVFGAGGFIGTYVTDKLVESGRKVLTSDMNELGEAYYSRRGLPYVRLDITRKEAFSALPTSGVDAVVHLACVQPANVSEQKYDAADFVRVNVLGTLNVLEYCRAARIPKIIYTCSHRNTQGMWADKEGVGIRETDGRSIKYTGDYAMFSISESAAADCVEHYAQAYGIEGVVLRLPPVYGYGPHTEIFKDGKPIKTGFQIFIDAAREGKPLELWGNPENGRDIVYVKDVVAAVEAALVRTGIGGLYNISSGRRLSLREQAEAIVRVFSPEGEPSAIRVLPDKPNLIDSYFYDVSKAKAVLGWQPTYSFEDMLRDYQRELESGRFAFLVEKRRQMMGAPAALVQAGARLNRDNGGDDMEPYNVPGAELMGENVKAKLKSCGEGTKLQPLAKIANAHVVEIGSKTRIRDFVFIWGGQGVKIGDLCDIQPHVTVWGGGSLEVGDRVSIGPGTVLLTAVYSHEEGLRMVDGLEDGAAKALYGTLKVGSDVYIGANCTLMPDITIGEGAILGAGSFINKDCEPWGIYVGSPAKKIAVRPRPKVLATRAPPACRMHPRSGCPLRVSSGAGAYSREGGIPKTSPSTVRARSRVGSMGNTSLQRRRSAPRRLASRSSRVTSARTASLSAEPAWPRSRTMLSAAPFARSSA